MTLFNKQTKSAPIFLLLILPLLWPTVLTVYFHKKKDRGIMHFHNLEKKLRFEEKVANLTKDKNGKKVQKLKGEISLKIQHFPTISCSRAEVYTNPYDTIRYPLCQSKYCFDFAGTRISPYSKEHDYQEQECDTHNWCDYVGNRCSGVDVYYKREKKPRQFKRKKVKAKFVEYTGVLCCCRNINQCNNESRAWKIYWGWMDYPMQIVLDNKNSSQNPLAISAKSTNPKPLVLKSTAVNSTTVHIYALADFVTVILCTLMHIHITCRMLY